ncbi:hypothetical protein [Gimesia fumaroli]|uniref:Uncharacterized protein n=1 Tax=Gimesia fumaroli TaxID=2527976 RepID=A0A518IHC0_9PLAN|nr:hypothetical protein [Gimesia fumaroli]QDV52477.1 hypothetical protein Enr17x_45400 [Gimesia fumaroli]
MSLIKNMNLKKVCLSVGCFLAIGMVSLAESNAGIIPWTYNAIFGPSRNGPMYRAAYAPQPYTANYGGYGMMNSGSCCGTPGYTANYGAARPAQSRRASRAAYRWYLINNPQVVGVSYNSFGGGSSTQFAGVAYGPTGNCGPCGMGGCGIGGCSTGACGAGGCSTGQCGVNYNPVANPASASTPTPDPNAGGKVPTPRDVENTPPKTYSEKPMAPENKEESIEDSGFGARRYNPSPMDTPMPKNEAKDLFETPIKGNETESPMPEAKPALPDFGTEKPEFGTEKKSDDDFFGTGENKAFKPTPDGKLPKTAIPQKKAAPTTTPGKDAPKAEQGINLPPLRVRPLNLDQKITWKSAPRAERLTIRAHFSAPRIAKQDVPANSGWFAITDTAKVASK